jgi:hypothetical protein
MSCMQRFNSTTDSVRIYLLSSPGSTFYPFPHGINISIRTYRPWVNAQKIYMRIDKVETTNFLPHIHTHTHTHTHTNTIFGTKTMSYTRAFLYFPVLFSYYTIQLVDASSLPNKSYQVYIIIKSS